MHTRTARSTLSTLGLDGLRRSRTDAVLIARITSLEARTHLDLVFATRPIPAEQALPWVQNSLSQGAQLSGAVRSSVEWSRGTFYALVPVSWQQPARLNFARGGVARTTAASIALVTSLYDLAGRTDACLIVEDDLRRADDPATSALPIPSASIDDRVFHWCDLSSSSADEVSTTVRRGASGYPLNAFVVSRPCQGLGLHPGGRYGPELAYEVASGLAAIIVSAFDGESFLLWRMSDQEPVA